MNEKQKKYDIHTTYLMIAKLLSQRSYCNRLKVGCIIVKNKNIISSGYNGTIPGFENCCEINDETSETVIHAEMNALLKLTASHESSEGACLYVTHSPCVNCAKHIIQAKIKRVIYINPYRDTRGIDILKQAGVIVQHFSELKPK